MNDIQEITQYLEQIFDLYMVNKYDFFFVYDERTQEQIPITPFPNGEVDDESLKKYRIVWESQRMKYSVWMQRPPENTGINIRFSAFIINIWIAGIGIVISRMKCLLQENYC